MNPLKKKAALDTAKFVCGIFGVIIGVDLIVAYAPLIQVSIADVALVLSTGVLIYMIRMMYLMRLEKLERDEKLRNLKKV